MNTFLQRTQHAVAIALSGGMTLAILTSIHLLASEPQIEVQAQLAAAAASQAQAAQSAVATPRQGA